MLASSYRLVSRRVEAQLVARRSLSSAPAEKLKCIFEEYRRENYSRETPMRFRKEVVQSVCSSAYTDSTEIDIDRINKLLRNIGHEEDCLSRRDQDILLDEAIGHHDKRSIPVSNLMKLM